MGSIATLGLAHLELDWQKNHIAHNHSKLFQKNDFKVVPYYYAEDDDKEAGEVAQKTALSKPLHSVKARLELLGYTLPAIKAIYNSMRQEDGRHALDGALTYSFSHFSKILKGVNANKFTPNLMYQDYDPGELVEKGIFQDIQFKDLAVNKSEGMFFENIDPYLVLRLLAENPANLETEVIWRFQDLIEGGWYSESKIFEPLAQEDKFLIVTEGSSDSIIIEKALRLLRPEIADFFYFVDMEKNYPFTGTGNLHNFCQGLSRIKIQNRILIVYDNDLEGVIKFEQTESLELPLNMRVMKLPNLSELTRFRTVGPQGSASVDVNGRASSIECFLDLSFRERNPPWIQWTNFVEKRNSYQGALNNKSKYVRHFKKVRKLTDAYDFSKLDRLLSEVISKCIKISESQMTSKSLG